MSEMSKVKPDALQAARSLRSIEVELPDGWKVQRIITEWGLGRIAAVIDAFAAEAVAAERERIAQRVSEREIVRLSVGRDPLVEVNEIIQDLAHDIATDWEDYVDE
jgi:hypothetical protein